MTKYAIILPDGAADEPIAQLNHRTPLQVAHTPHMDDVANRGLIGRVQTVPDGFSAGSDVCTLTLMGVDVRNHYTGRAPIEAAGRALMLDPRDVVFRCNLVTICDDRMTDFTAGHIEQEHAGALIRSLNEFFAGDTVTFFEGIQYRHLMVMHNAASLKLECTPPHDIPGEPISGYLPRGDDSNRIAGIMGQAAELLADHPVNRERTSTSRPPATHIWLWGQGVSPTLQTWSDRFGLRCAGIAAVDLIRGINRLLGFDVIDVPTATGYLDTDYAAKGAAIVAALDDYDLVSVHIEAPDEAGHLGDAAAKVSAIEQIDRLIVGPVLDRLQRESSWRILVAPDHPTCVATRKHSANPPPFAIAGTGIASGGAVNGFCESAAAGFFEPVGHNLINRLLGNTGVESS